MLLGVLLLFVPPLLPSEIRYADMYRKATRDRPLNLGEAKELLKAIPVTCVGNQLMSLTKISTHR